MAKYNKKRVSQTTPFRHTKRPILKDRGDDNIGPDVINRAGGMSYQQSRRLEFVSMLLTNFVKDQFYRKEKEVVDRVKELITLGLKDAISSHDLGAMKWYAKAAVYARRVFGMRSISHIVAAEIAALVKEEQWTKDFFNAIVFRLDDMLEIVAYYTDNYSTTTTTSGVKKARPLPNAMKKGFAKALESGRFDGYAMAKYRGEQRDISLVDIVNLIHPNPGNLPADKVATIQALNELINGKLKQTATWESKLSEAGQKGITDEDKAEAKVEAWVDMIRSKRLGYMAAIKNLRNILENVTDEALIAQVCDYLTNPKAISKSMVLPFRYLTAMKELQEMTGHKNIKLLRQVIGALGKALELSVDNCPTLSGTMLIAFDNSGSMFEFDGQPKEISKTGAIFAAILYKKNMAELMLFDNEGHYLNPDPNLPVITLAEQILNAKPNRGSTDYNMIFVTANKAYDRIVILSDAQGWVSGGAPDSTYNQYKRKYGCYPHVYSIDLTGYGDMMFSPEQIYCLAGVSDRVFEIMKMLEQDKNALISVIDQVDLSAKEPCVFNMQSG